MNIAIKALLLPMQHHYDHWIMSEELMLFIIVLVPVVVKHKRSFLCIHNREQHDMRVEL